MATTAGIHVHVDPSQISHHYHPADSSCHEYGTLDLGKPGHAANASVFFEDTAAIDTAIAELVALKQEMEPPVITDSERTCDQANPGTGAWCHRDGDHGVHEDTDGEKWRTGATQDHPFDAGEGNRGLTGPGRELLRAAIAEEDAAVNAAEYHEPASVKL